MVCHGGEMGQKRSKKSETTYDVIYGWPPWEMKMKIASFLLCKASSF